MMFVNIAMVMLDITIIIITGVMMREFPLEESICVYVCVSVKGGVSRDWRDIYVMISRRYCGGLG